MSLAVHPGQERLDLTYIVPGLPPLPGFDPTTVATWVYLITKLDEDDWLSKVGVCFNGSRRLRDHRREGWSLVERWRWPRWEVAYGEERAALREAERLGAKPHGRPLPGLSPTRLRQGGHTECFDAAYTEAIRAFLASRFDAWGPSVSPH
jgi:hypothetical protein